MYLGVVILGLPEEKFWDLTPRKFFTLMEMHKRANSTDDDNTGSSSSSSSTAKGSPMTLEDLARYQF